MSELASVAKLNGENYQLWSYKIKLYLMKENLCEVVDKFIPTYPDQIWNDENNKAMAIIGLSVEDNQLVYIKNLKTARDYWLALQKHHEKSSSINKVILLKKLCKLQLRKHQTMDDHLTDMLEIVGRLSALGETLEEKLVLALLLGSLPDSYNGLVTALESRPEEDLTLELIKGKLLQEYQRIKERQPENESSSSSRVKRQCTHCKKFGHLEHQCFKLVKEKETFVQIDICSFCQRVGHKQNNCSAYVAELARRNLVCTYCKATGHLQDSCRKAAKDAVRRHCTYCSKYGHTRDVCPKSRDEKDKVSQIVEITKDIAEIYQNRNQNRQRTNKKESDCVIS